MAFWLLIACYLEQRDQTYKEVIFSPDWHQPPAVQYRTTHYLLQTPHYWILTTNWLAIFCFTLHLLRLKSNNFFIETSHQDNCFQSNQMCKYAGQDWVCCTNWNTQDKISASWFSRANCCSQSVYTSLAWTIKLFFKNSINLNILITSYEAIMTFIDVFRKGFCT